MLKSWIWTPVFGLINNKWFSAVQRGIYNVNHTINESAEKNIYIYLINWDMHICKSCEDRKQVIDLFNLCNHDKRVAGQTMPFRSWEQLPHTHIHGLLIVLMFFDEITVLIDRKQRMVFHSVTLKVLSVSFNRCRAYFMSV